MLLRALFDGSISAPASAKVGSGIVGGVLITTDGTNAAVVIVRRGDSAGKQVFKISTKTPLFVKAPIGLEGTTDAYCDVSGTGAAAQFYEWLE